MTETLPQENVPTLERAIARKIVGLALVLGAGCAAWMASSAGLRGAGASLAGTALGIGNLWLLARLVLRLLDPRVEAGKGTAAVLLLAKSATLFGVAGLLITRPWIDRGAFIAGLSSVIAAVAAGAMWDAITPKPEAP